MTTLIAAMDTLVARLQAVMPDIENISADAPPLQRRSLKLPAIYLEIASIEDAGANGDSRVLATLRLQARCLYDPNIARSDLLARALAVRVLTALHEIRRPIPGHGHIRDLRAGEDEFRPDIDGYTVWLVEATLELALGELEAEPPVPSTVLFAIAPEIGTPHQDGYQTLTGSLT